MAVATIATCAPMNPANQAREIERYLRELRADGVIVPGGQDSAAIGVARSLGLTIIELSVLPDAPAGVFELHGERRVAAPSRRPFTSDEPAFVLPTSGTTSRPKLVPLRHAAMCAGAGRVGKSLDLTPSDRCLGMMPLFHIHGLMAALAALSRGASIICSPPFDPVASLAWLEELAPTYYTAVPTMHQALLSEARRRGRSTFRSSLRVIRSCSAPLPRRVMAELEQVFGVPVLEAYGMTEAAHQISSNPLPPQARKPGSVGRAEGLEVAVTDGEGRSLPIGTTGEVVIRGAGVMTGYENDPVANAGAFFGEWFRTGDLGHLDDEGYLFLTGRRKELINRGGEKIAPREIDDVLLEHPAVAQAVAFAMPHPTLGEDVAAAVVLRPGASATDRELQRFAARQLAAFKVPRRVAFLDEIPRGASGKVQRAGLATALQFDVLPAQEGDAARGPLEATLVRLCAETLGIPEVGVHDDFFGLGGDSILATQLVSRVRQALGVELSLLAVFETPTMAELAGVLEKLESPWAAQPALAPRSTRETDIPLAFAQTRLWFGNQYDPESHTYNRVSAHRLRGGLDQDALARALTEHHLCRG
jgi:oxalate---CoA ligase